MQVHTVLPAVAAQRPSTQRYAVVHCDAAPLTCQEYNVTAVPEGWVVASLAAEAERVAVVRLVYRDRSFTFQRDAGGPSVRSLVVPPLSSPPLVQ